MLTKIIRHIENRVTFKPQLAKAVDLSRFQQEEQLLKFDQQLVSIRYKLNKSPNFLFFSHGNGSSVDSIAHIYSYYEELGVSYLAYDYPGYGKSIGNVSEIGCYRAFHTAFEFIVNELKIPVQQIVCHGLSLGGAVAINALKDYPIRRMIFEATFTSSSAIAEHKFPHIPFIRKMANQFNSIDNIKYLSGYVLFIHGALDQVIPADHSQKLYDACVAQKQLYIIPNCGHAEHARLGGAEYRQVWRQFLDGRR